MSKPLLKCEWEVLREQLKSEKNVLKALEEHYNEAVKDIDSKIASMLGRNDANLPHVIRRVEYQKMLKAQVKAALDVLHAKEYETISGYLEEAYTDAFVGSVYTLHHQGVPVIIPIDQNAVVKAVTIDSKIKGDLYASLGVDVNRLKKAIASEITRGIASGMLYDEIARSIKSASGISFRRARTITRTEAGRVQEQATYDAAQEAKAAGADVVKQWSAMMDSKTRDTHRQLDGQIREVKEYFTVNGHKALHPHGFNLAEEDINCRCTVLTRARAALDEDELKILQERAAQHGLLVKDSKKFGKAQAKNLAEFKKNYLKAAEEVAEYEKLTPEEKKRLFDDNKKEIQKLISKKKQEELKFITSADVEEIQAAQRNVQEIQKRIDQLTSTNKQLEKDILASRGKQVVGLKNGAEAVKKVSTKSTIEQCETIEEVEALMKSKRWFQVATIDGKIFDTNESISLHGVDLEAAKTVYDTCERIFTKFPQLVGKLNSVSSDFGGGMEYAKCVSGFGHGGIILNTRYFRSAKFLEKSYKKDVEQGFHPIGTQYGSIFTHEFGHAIDDYLTYTLRVAGKTTKGMTKIVSAAMRPKVMRACKLEVSEIGKEVSGYATKDPMEWFAECFAEYMDSDNPRRVAAEFGKQLEEFLKEVK